MKSPKMKGPSAEELEATRLQNEQMAKRNTQLDADERKRKQELAESTSGLAGNRVGVRSLLSGDWGGFDRGGGLGAR